LEPYFNKKDKIQSKYNLISWPFQHIRCSLLYEEHLKNDLHQPLICRFGIWNTALYSGGVYN